MDLDLALREDKPAGLTDTSTAEDRIKFEKWERANRMSMMIMKKAMAQSVKGGIPKHTSAKGFLAAIEEKFKESEKAETGTFLTQLTSIKFDGVGSDLEVAVTDQFLVHMALNSLPAKYGQLKVSYNTSKVKWGIDELISMCAQEEDRLKTDKTMEVHFVQTEKGIKAPNAGSVNAAYKKKKKVISSPPIKNTNTFKGSHKLKPVNTEIDKENECYFCKETGHMRKNCTGFKNWLVRKGVLKTREIDNEVYNVFVGNGSKLAVESIGSVKLVLASGFILNLSPVLFVPSMRMSLISASKFSYVFLISDKSLALDCFKIFHLEVEKQLEKRIKIVRSDLGGEYFGRYTETGQHKGPFATYLEQNSIVAQYTTPGTPH
ncbi:uncharacterized protein [Malus domestica]|uniref:uncharacterized protein n=1 Tax=Malus domestica TaxID=3750 RepID=UPI0010A9DA7F|nr:uncharacterized protein LOC114827098 [Malus domestica]